MNEMYCALERLGAHRWLLAAIGSWNDTATDGEVLELLRDVNAGTFEMHVIASTSLPAGSKHKPE